MLTRSIEVQKYVRASAGRVGLSVVFEEVNQPRHDGNTVYLPRITAETSIEDLKNLMASTDHEVAHDRFSSFQVLKDKGLDPMSMLMFTWNFLEDSRVNTIEAAEYRGFKENWDDCGALVTSKLLKKIKDDVPSNPAMGDLFTSLICWEATINSSVFPRIELETSKFEPNEKYMDVLKNFDVDLTDCHKILNKELGTTSTYDLAHAILKDLSDKLPPGTLPEDAADGKTPMKGKKKAKGEKGEGDPSADSEEVPAEICDAEKGEVGEGKRPEEEEYKILKVKLTEKDMEKFSLTAPRTGEKMGKVGLNFDPVRSDTRNWEMTDFDKFIVVDYPRNICSCIEQKYLGTNGDTRDFVSKYKIRVVPKLITQENFAQQVRRLIQIRAKVQTQYAVRRGKLDQARLSRICFDAPGFNEKVFKRKIENKTLDAAITVLVDMSGSMTGDKAYYALASTLLLNEVCSTLNIPVEILGFTDDYRLEDFEVAPVMYIYKAFSNLKVPSSDLIEHFSKSSRFMTGNPDGENIVWAYHRLLKRKEKKKLLIVMSDGNPAASKSSVGLEGFTRKVIKEIEKDPRVDIYGLGLCSDSVNEFYKARSVVYSASEIPKALIHLIEQRILK